MDSASFQFTFKNIVDHVYFMSVYGLMLWIILHYNWRKYHYRKRQAQLLEALVNEVEIKPRMKKYMEKELADIQNPIRFWFKENASLVVAAVFVSFTLVAWDDELLDGYNSFVEQDITLDKWMYLAPPFMTMTILKIIFKDEKLLMNDN